MNLTRHRRNLGLLLSILAFGAAAPASAQLLLDPPLLVSPPDSDTHQDPIVRLIWHSVLGATGYHSQASRTNNFASPLMDTISADTVTILTNLNPLSHYWWRVAARNGSGDGPWSAGRTFMTISWDGIPENIGGQFPGQYLLFQNYPNPFNPTTTIRYVLPQRAHVTLIVFNTLGQQIATPVDAVEEQGEHSVRFDGSGLASGVYYYRISTGPYAPVKKLLLLK